MGAGQTRAHTCHWPGCNLQVKPAVWGCRPHWYRLPKALRDAIWASYEPGQEKTMRPSEAYLDAAQAVQAWIATLQHTCNGYPNTYPPNGYPCGWCGSEGPP